MSGQRGFSRAGIGISSDLDPTAWLESPFDAFTAAGVQDSSGLSGSYVGEEISAVIDQGTEIELKVLDETLGDLFFAFQDVTGADPVHMVPEVLCRQRRRIGGQYLLLAAINRAVSPSSKLQFAGWYRETALKRLLPTDPAALSAQNLENLQKL